MSLLFLQALNLPYTLPTYLLIRYEDSLRLPQASIDHVYCVRFRNVNKKIEGCEHILFMKLTLMFQLDCYTIRNVQTYANIIVYFYPILFPNFKLKRLIIIKSSGTLAQTSYIKVTKRTLPYVNCLVQSEDVLWEKAQWVVQ